MGLFGELCLLKELLISATDYKFIIDGWRRPKYSTHDFDYTETAYEVKTTGLTTTSIKIQSEHQLDKLDHHNLYLICFRVECFPSNSKNSIIDLTQDIATIIKNPILLDEIYEKIGSDLSAYNFDIKPQFKIINKVTESFPKITSTDLNENIFSVKYEISMSYLEENGKKSKMD
jgi:hypothetical protein